MNDTLGSPVPVTMAARATMSQRRPIVIILGMHRSGTSLCSHVLSALGFDMADAIAAHESNAKGHWERRQIVDLNDRILEHFNRGFYTLHHDFGLPVAWWADPQVGKSRREIVAYLAGRMGDAPFGFKDPRTARLMPMWHQIFGELRLEPKFIICLRNPAQVARSLHARDGLAPEIGEFRWFSYVIECFQHTKNHGVCLLEYEAWFDAPKANLEKLREFVGGFPLDREVDVDAVLADIVDDQLRHDNPQLAEAQHPLIRSLYALAQRAGDDPAARAQIQNIAVQYRGFDQMQRPFHRAFEANSAIALQLPAREQTIAELAKAAETAQAEIARLHDAQTQAQRKIAELTRQRDAVMRATAEALHDEIAGLREGLTQTEREAAGLREALAAAERKARELERIAGELKAAPAERSAGAIRRLTQHLRQRRRRRGIGALIRAGDRARDAGDWALAAPYYRRTLEQAPEFAPIWVQLGHALKEQGDCAGAEAAYRCSLALDRSVRDTVQQLGHVLKLQGRWEEAADAYVRAMQIEPGQEDAGPEVELLFRGFVEEGDKAWDARSWPVAARHYRRALAMQPDLMPIWLRLGHALREQGDYAGAEAAYRQAWALDRSIADIHLQLGDLLRLQGRRMQAIDAYATAIRLDPGLSVAREALQSLVGASPSQTERAIVVALPAAAGSALPNGAAVAVDGLELAERYGELSADAGRKTGTGYDVIWLG